MKQILTFRVFIIVWFFIAFIFYSCSKGGGGGGPAPPSNPCNGVTITVTGTILNPSAAGSNDGSIAATASGSTGFTFNINGGAFQASGNFTNLAAGSYTIVARNGSGCTGSSSFTLTAPNPCTGITISLNTSATPNSPCQAGGTGTITVTASGGAAPFTYSLNSGVFQASNLFSNLVDGSYTITAKDANGCTGNGSTTIGNVPPGSLFIAVRNLIQSECVTCHNGAQAEGGMNFTVDCNIVANKDRIKARAVDGNPSQMPPTGPLPASERQKITNWINAGGLFTN